METNNLVETRTGSLKLQVWSEGPFIFKGDNLKVLRNAINQVQSGAVFFLNLSPKPLKPSRRAYTKPCLKIVAGGGRQVYSMSSKELTGLAAALKKAEAGEQSQFGFGYKILGPCDSRKEVVLGAQKEVENDLA